MFPNAWAATPDEHLEKGASFQVFVVHWGFGLFGYLVIWLFGYLVIWLFGYLVIWLFGYLVIWLFGYLVLVLVLILILFCYALDVSVS